MVLAFVRTVSKLNANEFIVKSFEFIRTDNFEQIKSKISTLPFEWSYKTIMLGFFLLSRVTPTFLCIAESTVTSFLPVFILSLYDFLSLYYLFIVFRVAIFCPLFFSTSQFFHFFQYSFPISYNCSDNGYFFFSKDHRAKVILVK